LVELLVDLPERNLRKGRIGSVIGVFDDGVEVEFLDDLGLATRVLLAEAQLATACSGPPSR
jgi:hypothetical protein